MCLPQLCQFDPSSILCHDSKGLISHKHVQFTQLRSQLVRSHAPEELARGESDQVSIVTFFEEKEAVVNMIIIGRSPTTRHVFRSHRVALDWLFDRINLAPRTNIRYVYTVHPLADILTTALSHVLSGTISFFWLIKAIPAQTFLSSDSSHQTMSNKWREKTGQKKE